MHFIGLYWNWTKNRYAENASTSVIVYSLFPLGIGLSFRHWCTVVFLFQHLMSVFPCSINQTDQMLVHLQSFNSMPEHYTIPESTKNGVPLFYIPPGSTTPVRAVISLIHHLSSTYHGVSSSLFQHVIRGQHLVVLIKSLRWVEKHPRVNY